MVQVKVEKAKIDQKQTPLLVIGVFEGEQDFPHSKELDSSVSSSIWETLENKEFRGTFGSSIVVYTLGKGPMKKIMLAWSWQAGKIHGRKCADLCGQGNAEGSRAGNKGIFNITVLKP